MAKPFHSEYVIEKDLWQGGYICNKCGCEKDHHLYRIRNQRYCFGKEIFATTQKYLSGCDACKSIREIDKQKFVRLHQCQKASYETGAFPKEVILADFTPDQIKLQKYSARLLLATIYAIIMTIGTVNLWIQLNRVLNAIFYIPAMVFMGLGWIPFVIVMLQYAPVKKKYKMYLEVGGTPLGEEDNKDEKIEEKED